MKKEIIINIKELEELVLNLNYIYSSNNDNFTKTEENAITKAYILSKKIKNISTTKIKKDNGYSIIKRFYDSSKEKIIDTNIRHNNPFISLKDKYDILKMNMDIYLSLEKIEDKNKNPFISFYNNEKKKEYYQEIKQSINSIKKINRELYS
jgi:hypothetical protein